MNRAYWNNGGDPDEESIATGLEAVLSSRALRLPPGVVEQHVERLLSRLTPAEADNFMSALGDVGKQIGKFTQSKEFKGIASTALPIAGMAAGTFIGGPAGAALGSTLGGVAGQAIAGGGGAATRRAVAQGAPAVLSAVQAAGVPVPPTVAAAVPHVSAAIGGSTSAAQLLGILQNPALMSSLLALAMGSHGKTSVPLPGTGSEVPVGAMMNLVGTLANRAAEDAEEILALHEESYPDYLLDETGCLACDPSVASQRADALLRTIAVDAETAAESADDWPDDDTW